MNKRILERIAYHEAGHAVAHYLFNVQFKRIEIFDDENAPNFKLHPKVKKRLGIKDVKAGGIIKAIRRKQTFSDRDLIFFTLAGAAAESIRYKDSLLATLFRNKHEWAYAEVVFRDRGDIDFWFDCARKTLKMPKIWQAVVTLAKELMIHRRIPYKRAVEIIDGKMKQSK
jgi:hypothetical protein